MKVLLWRMVARARYFLEIMAGILPSTCRKKAEVVTSHDLSVFFLFTMTQWVKIVTY